MKMNTHVPHVETSADLEEKMFGIGDAGMVFDILRSKMYSNPILAICREISCNARDAHREIGNDNTPVEITLPNSLEPTYKIKDYGPGIAPDRVENIFIKYCASTKREDNIQTGFFGLGSKSPFSYSDTFSIVTNVNGIQYNYSCFIDETKVGKLALLSEMSTTEANGTTIIIPVKSADFNFFRDYTEQATRHWKLRPTIKGGTVQWKNLTPKLQGKNWIVNKTEEYSYNREVKLIVDGVEYPLNVNDLRKCADAKIIDACQGSFYFYFGVGELSLSANREQVHFDKPTQDKLTLRLKEVTDDINKVISDQLEKFDNYWQANVYYRKELCQTFSNLAALGPLTWHGYKLHDHYLDLGCDVFSFAKGKYSRKRLVTDSDKLRRSRGRSIVFEEKTKLIVNDLSIKEPTPKHIKKIFDEDSDLKNAFVICPNDNMTIQKLNDDFHLNEMGHLMLSDLTRANGRPYKASANRLLVFKFELGPCHFRQVSYSSMEEDTNKIKILCRLSKDPYSTNRITHINKKAVSTNVLTSLLKQVPNVSLYGVDASADQARIDEDFAGMGNLQDFIDEHILNNKNVDFCKIKYVLGQRYYINERLLKSYDVYFSKVKNQNSLFMQKLKVNKTLKEISEQDFSLLDIYENFKGYIDDKEVDIWRKNHEEYDLNIINEKCSYKYPLIDAINSYQLESLTDHVADYINLIDSK